MSKDYLHPETNKVAPQANKPSKRTAMPKNSSGVFDRTKATDPHMPATAMPLPIHSAAAIFLVRESLLSFDPIGLVVIGLLSFAIFGAGGNLS